MTRGISNNNPTNIRQSGNIWYGMAVTQSDHDYVQFQSPELGLRAACKILLSYAGRGLDTVQSIIDEWAPPIENDSTAYVEDACQRTGYTATAHLDMKSPEVLENLLKSIVWHENGEQPYGDDVYSAAVAMALPTPTPGDGLGGSNGTSGSATA